MWLNGRTKGEHSNYCVIIRIQDYSQQLVCLALKNENWDKQLTSLCHSSLLNLVHFIQFWFSHEKFLHLLRLFSSQFKAWNRWCIFLCWAFQLDSNEPVSEDKNCVRATVGLFPLYLELVLVINDRETNPTRHEFYIRLFMCARAVLLHSSLLDVSRRHGMEGKGSKTTNARKYLLYFCKMKIRKRKQICNCWAAYRFIYTSSVDRKSTAGPIMCLRGVIYEAWNWILCSSRHIAVTTRWYESEEDGKTAHNNDTSMQTGGYMCRQKYTQSKHASKLFVIYAYKVDLNNSCCNPASRTIRASSNLLIPLLQPLFLLPNITLQRVEHRLSAWYIYKCPPS